MRKQILVVDDDSAIQRLVTATLGTTDFDVIIAADGKAAVKRATAEQPDIILLDVSLPEMDGFAVVKELRANDATRCIPILMLTARGSPDDHAKGEALGVNRYFVKPFSPLQLLRAIYELIESDASSVQWSMDRSSR